MSAVEERARRQHDDAERLNLHLHKLVLFFVFSRDANLLRVDNNHASTPMNENGEFLTKSLRGGLATRRYRDEEAGGDKKIHRIKSYHVIFICLTNYRQSN